MILVFKIMRASYAYFETINSNEKIRLLRVYETPQKHGELTPNYNTVHMLPLLLTLIVRSS